MNPAQLMKAYALIAKKHGLTSMEQAGCSVSRKEFSDPIEAWRELQKFSPQQGWIQFQSQVTAFQNAQLPEPDDDWGCVLAAETVDAQGRAMHLRQSPAGGWHLYLMTPRDAADAATGEVYLVDEVKHLASKKAFGGRLRHRRYWRMDADSGATPAFAVFQGFVAKEDI